MEALVFIFIAAAAIFGAVLRSKWKEKQERDRQRDENIGALVDLGLQVEEIIGRIKSLKTTTPKVSACGRAIAVLNEAEQYPECREVLTNYDELKERIRCIGRVLPAVNAVEKAYKHRFKGSKKPEMNALLDALYHIKTNNVTDREFSVAEVFPEGTGEIIEIGSIEGRLRELGWEGDQLASQPATSPELSRD